MIKGYVYVTKHAIDRMRERFCRGDPSEEKVRSVIVACARKAVPFGAQKGKQRMWLAEAFEGQAEIVIVTGPNNVRKGVTVVTVLTKDQAILNMQQARLC